MEVQQTLPSWTGVILVVDDEAVLRGLLVRTLTDAGFDVLQADNGKTALEVARGSAVPVSLVISDISMPVMDGLQLSRRFRALYPVVPILLISGNPHWAGPDQSVFDGEQILRKPFTVDSLLTAVTGMLTPGLRARDEIA
jgi:two-component system, cell cycle sensor histidine kinase and response regulator CckA